MASGAKKKLSSLAAGHEKIGREKLFDLLSEYLEVERGGVQLYTQALDRATIPMVQNTLQKFLRQTEKHVDLLQNAIRDLGGNPVYLSPGAQIVQSRVEAMLSLSVPSHFQQVVDMENLLLAETKDQADWSFLKSIISSIADVHARDIVREIVDEVEDEEDIHVHWARETLERMVKEDLLHPGDLREEETAA